jgi:hypothetical protein
MAQFKPKTVYVTYIKTTPEKLGCPAAAGIHARLWGRHSAPFGYENLVSIVDLWPVAAL